MKRVASLPRGVYLIGAHTHMAKEEQKMEQIQMKHEDLEILKEAIEAEGALIGAFGLEAVRAGENPAPCGDYKVSSIVLDLGTIDDEYGMAVLRAGCQAEWQWPWTRPIVTWMSVDIYVTDGPGAWRRYTHLAVGNAVDRCITRPLLEAIKRWWRDAAGLDPEAVIAATGSAN